jgi:lipoyl(octanoyl) transferase
VDARGVTRHGFALNIDTDREYWQGIIACGIGDHPVINLSELIDPLPATARVMDAVVESFGAVLQYEMQETTLA